MKKISLFILAVVPFIIFMIGYTAAYFFLQKSYVTVPSLLGKSVRDGATMLAQRGLFLSVLKEEENALVKDGTILHQVPLAGQQSKFQKPVYVTISKNTPLKRAPAFFGLGAENIEQLAKKTKLKATIVKLNVNYSRDLCFAQSPQPGEPSVDGSVIVYVAQGNDKWHMVPDIRGLWYEQTVAQLAKIGITHDVFNVRDEAELSLPDGHKIIDQRPRAGIFVIADQPLHLQMQVE